MSSRGVTSKVLRINGFILRFFPVVSYLIMNGHEFTVSQLRKVFSQGTVHSFLNRGLNVGAIVKVEDGRYRLTITLEEIRLSKDVDVEAERVLIKNGYAMVIE